MKAQNPEHLFGEMTVSTLISTGTRAEINAGTQSLIQFRDAQ